MRPVVIASPISLIPYFISGTVNFDDPYIRLSSAADEVLLIQGATVELTQRGAEVLALSQSPTYQQLSGLRFWSKRIQVAVAKMRRQIGLIGKSHIDMDNFKFLHASDE